MKKFLFPLQCCAVLSSPSLFASDLFVTLEKSYNIINLQKAKAQNPTIDGSNVVVGVVDSLFNPEHPSLKDKVIEIGGYKNFDDIYKNDASSIGSAQKDNATFRHGTHVAGILLGRHLGRTPTFENNGDPYGVAPNAKFYGAAFKESSNFNYWNLNLFDFFSKDPKLNIVNHSWGYKVFPYEQNISSYEQALKEVEKDGSSGYYNKNEVERIVKLAKERKVLNVFGSGNEGKNSASLFELLPRYDEDIRSFIAVGMLDADGIDIASDGKIIIKEKRVNTLTSGEERTLTLQGIHKYSNGFLGSQAYSLMAPGSKIDAANALFDVHNKLNREKQEEFIPLTGTSQAAPMVSGAAALVAQKFPFLNGKQIADVLLSTANQNYTLPKVIIKQKPNYDAFSVIYIDQDIPQDEAQIRQDIAELGYSDTPVTLNKILTNKTLYSLKREDLMGQGILDVQKALNGVATLDANRLNLGDIQSPTGKSEAYYLIDTQGQNSEFANNIDQKMWDDSLHLATAKNSPAEQMRGLNVGFIKQGLGQLSFSGSNSYKGATLVRGGELRLKSGSALSESSVFVEQDGTLSGSGTIANNLDNKGTVIAGSDDIATLTVGKNYTHHGTAKLVLNFNTQGNSKLVAQHYDIKGGKLLYRPLSGQFYAAGQKVQIDLGSLANSLNRFESVEILSNGSTEFKIADFKLASNRTVINDDTIEEKPVTEPQPSDTAKEESSSEAASTEQPNTEVKPSDTVKEESSPETVSIEQPNAEAKPSDTVKEESTSETASTEQPNTEVKPNDTVKEESSPETVSIEQPNAEAKPSDTVKEESTSETASTEQPSTEVKPNDNVTEESTSETVSTEQPNNVEKKKEKVETIPAQDGTLIAEVKVKKEAFYIPNSDIGEAIYTARTSADLSQAYRDFFVKLDNTANRQAVLNSIAEDHLPDMLNDSTIKTTHFAQQNLLFSLTPNYFVQRFNTNGIKKLVGGEDVFLSKLAKNNLAQKKYAFYLTPSYHITQANEFKANSHGLHMGVATNIDNKQQLAMSLNYERGKGTFHSANSHSDTFNVALNYVSHFDHFKLLSGVNLGKSQNHYEKQIVGERENITGSYQNRFASAQLGVAKSYKRENVTLLPLTYFNYDFVHQNAFNESGWIFTKSYDSVNYHSTAMGAGLLLNYATTLDNAQIQFNSYVIYQHRLSGRNYRNNAKFSEIANSHFTQTYRLTPSLFTLGFSSRVNFNNGFFAQLALESVLTPSQKTRNILATLGYQF
ncbi:S8 family serine peptidase [Glaesserella parasuis]|uniref:S8 family serine peptidase n=1 Tax=Glaesserella parasuis TaxID=738 RepID=UPI00094FAA63|nr:S8 family serine peptidase [Glaesserella parasuis]MDG6345931.1 S8 family serine peptidase [Glaesserella parasuis]MDG6771555.1 S8 family serine peptidase [Glaesserella parasuis]MDO9873686.1 S8 family serine peptidase [Glaesserella parasuis]MWQ32956.1 S8 family serine peptidase [Glaesserella parasuis]QKJ69141.1 S8 family serine peptidase [Glaesserella parasuis]